MAATAVHALPATAAIAHSDPSVPASVRNDRTLAISTGLASAAIAVVKARASMSGTTCPA